MSIQAKIFLTAAPGINPKIVDAGKQAKTSVRKNRSRRFVSKDKNLILQAERKSSPPLTMSRQLLSRDFLLTLSLILSLILSSRLRKPLRLTFQMTFQKIKLSQIDRGKVE